MSKCNLKKFKNNFVFFRINFPYKIDRYSGRSEAENLASNLLISSEKENLKIIPISLEILLFFIKQIIFDKVKTEI